MNTAYTQNVSEQALYELFNRQTWTALFQHFLIGGLAGASGRSGIFTPNTLWNADDHRTPRHIRKKRRHVLTTPVIPLATVKNQNRPCTLPCAPWAAVPSVAPMTMRSVVATSAALRPTLSQRSPTETWPRTAPGRDIGSYRHTFTGTNHQRVGTYRRVRRWTHGSRHRRCIPWDRVS